MPGYHVGGDVYPVLGQHRAAPHPGDRRLPPGQVRGERGEPECQDGGGSAAEGGQLPKRGGGGGDAGAQPDHRPPQPPGLCAESLHEGQCGDFVCLSFFTYFCMLVVYTAWLLTSWTTWSLCKKSSWRSTWWLCWFFQKFFLLLFCFCFYIGGVAGKSFSCVMLIIMITRSRNALNSALRACKKPTNLNRHWIIMILICNQS